jgi:hypothetical protein
VTRLGKQQYETTQHLGQQRRVAQHAGGRKAFVLYRHHNWHNAQ